MVNLIKYDAACRAVAEAKAVDEVKEIRNQAIAMQEYARQSKNKELEADALEIRMRATRRLGEMMDKGKNDRAPLGRKEKRVFEKPFVPKPTLEEAGIDKNLAHQARSLASMSDRQFEASVEMGRNKVARVVKEVMNDYKNDTKQLERQINADAKFRMEWNAKEKSLQQGLVKSGSALIRAVGELTEHHRHRPDGITLLMSTEIGSMCDDLEIALIRLRKEL
jgi:hypothetical protein